MKTAFRVGLAFVLALGGCAVPGNPIPTPNLPPVTSTSVPYPTGHASQTPALILAVPRPRTPSPLVETATPASGAMSCLEGERTCIVAGHFAFRRPFEVSPSTKSDVDQTYRYGTTQNEKREAHHGLDFANAQGTPVLAVGDGEVVVAGNDKLTRYGWVTDFYGNLVVIAHRLPGFSEPVYSLYGHLYQVNVTTGQQVKAGEKIGEVGATGIAIGSHLHLEVRVGRNDYQSTRNPEMWLRPPVGMGTLAGRVVDAQGNLVKSSIHIQRMQDGRILPDPIYQIETYAPAALNSDDIFHETFAAGELSAGEYRLTLIYNGVVYEQQVQIEPGFLTLVLFSVN